MSYPILYSATETNFDHNGIGILSACISCEVTEEANGIFELAMQYPMDGIHFSEIENRSIIKAKADQFRDPQLFRVYAISKHMSGNVSVLAEHISYDLTGIPVKPFSAVGAHLAMIGLRENAVVDCPFEFWTDKSAGSTFSVTQPSSIRSALGGVKGSILDVFGGEFEFDNYTVKLHTKRGMNRGVSIRYGKNLTDIQQDQICSAVATGVYPYWAGDVDGSAVLLELPEKIINAPGTYNFVKIRTLDLSGEFESKPTVDQLRSRAQTYINNNRIGVPSVSLSVSFSQLNQCDEYKNLDLLERVSLFDSVNVEFAALNVSETSKVVKVVYNVLSDRVESVTLGSVRSNIADTLSNQQKELDKIPIDLKKAQESATAWLTNGKGYKVERRDANGNVIDTLYLDTPNIDEAVNVLRIGQSGIGFSASGVDGPYYSAWTLDGRFNADFISGGTISSQDGKVRISLVGGAEPVSFSSGVSANQYILRGDQIDAPMVFYADSARINGKDTLRMLFYSDLGHGIGGLNGTFDVNGNPVGLQYRAFFTALDGTLGNGLSVATEQNGFAGFYLLDSSENIVGKFCTSDYIPGESELEVHRAKFETFDGKQLFWRQQDDGTYALMGRD